MGSKDTVAAKPHVKAEVAPVLIQAGESPIYRVHPKGGVIHPMEVVGGNVGFLASWENCATLLGSGSMMFLWRICCNSRLSPF